MAPPLGEAIFRPAALHAMGLLFAKGFKPMIGTYDGFEFPLAITIQRGDSDLVQ